MLIYFDNPGRCFKVIFLKTETIPLPKITFSDLFPFQIWRSYYNLKLVFSWPDGMQRLTLVISFWSTKRYVETHPECMCFTDHIVCDLFVHVQAVWSNLSCVLVCKNKGSESREVLFLFLLLSFLTSALTIFSITATQSNFLCNLFF